MKFVSCIIFLLLFLIGCNNSDKINLFINDIGNSYVLDRREGVFFISYTNSVEGVVLQGETDNPDAHKALLNKLTTNGYSVVDQIILLPNTPKPWGIVSLSVANLRNKPSHTAELSTQALMGTPVKILKEKGDWVLIQTPDRYLSWCEKNALKIKNQEEFKNWQRSNRILITSHLDHVIDTISGKVVSDVVAGCILEHIGSTANEAIVRLPDSRSGKIKLGNFINFNTWCDTDSVFADNLVETAELLIGLPYLWGGTSVKAADCSGFVKQVYFMNGLILSRDASQQVLYGKEVPIKKDFDHLRSGDLLFFGNSSPNTYPENITHVGMYIGDSEFIHASGRVKTNSFDSSKANYSTYYIDQLQAIRRLEGADYGKGIIKVRDHQWYRDN
jgi:gamma-D-glutamyl-L-lysine dipeptidyl-peptidase